MFQALSAVVPVFLIIALGVLLRSRDALPADTGPVLGRYVLRLALPLLLLHLLAGARPADMAHWGFWAGVVGSQLVVYAAGYYGDLLFCRRGAGPAVVAGLSCSACNAAFVGLPIIANLLPGDKEAMLVAGLAILAPNVVVLLAQSRLDFVSGGLTWKGENVCSFMGRLLRVAVLGNPIMLATLAGMVLCFTGLGLWAPLDSAASLIGHTAAPCMLLALGLDLRQKLLLAARQIQGRAFLRQAWFILCKLLLHPLLCWAIMHVLGLSGPWLAVGVIMSGTATALVVTVIAEVYRAAPEEAALTAVFSNGLSALTLTGFIWLFRSLGMV